MRRRLLVGAHSWALAAVLLASNAQAQGSLGGGSLGGSGSSVLGAAGRGISSTSINASGHLILTYSDSTTADAGLVVGTAGAAGRGISITAINASNHLVVTYSDSTTADLGLVVGSAGAAGKGVSSSVINSSGHLVLTYSDSTTSDLGNVVGTAGAAGKGISSTTISSSGHLVLTYTDSTTSDVGAVVGTAGAAGKGISSATINSSSHLVLTYSDSTSADLGVVVGSAGAAGKGVASFAINSSNHLVATYSDSTTQDIGALPAGSATVGSGTDLSPATVLTAGSTTARSTTARAGEVFNARDYGAQCNGSHLLISASVSSGGLGVSTFAQAAAYKAANGTYPLSWMTHANLDYRATLRVQVDATSGSNVLYVSDALGVPNGATISGNSAIPANTTVTVSNPGQITATASSAVAGPVAAANKYSPITMTKQITLSSIPAGLVVGSKPIPQAGLFWDDRIDSISGNTITLHWGATAAIAANASITFQPPSSLTLSNNLTSLVPSVLDGGATTSSHYWIVLTMAATDAQLAQAEMDYVGQQSAIMAGFASTSGGTAIMPAGYCVNDNANNIGTLIGSPWIPPSYQADGFATTNTVDVIGQGQGSTIETWPTDLGAGRWAFMMGDPAGNWINGLGAYGTNYYFGRLTDMSIRGPAFGQTHTFGIVPAHMGGIHRGARRQLDRVAATHFRCGWSYEGVDHTEDKDVQLGGNGYGICMGAAAKPLYGNSAIWHMENTGNTIAGILFDKNANWNTDVSGSTNYLAYSPYEMYLERGPQDVYGEPQGAIIVNSRFDDFNLEDTGIAILGDSNDGPLGTGSPAFDVQGVRFLNWGWGINPASFGIVGTPLSFYFNMRNAYNDVLQFGNVSPAALSGMLASFRVVNTGYNNGGLDLEGAVESVLAANSSAHIDTIFSLDHSQYSPTSQIELTDPGSMLSATCASTTDGTAIPVGSVLEQGGYGPALSGTAGAAGTAPIIGVNLTDVPATTGNSQMLCYATRWAAMNVNTSGAGPSTGFLAAAGSSAKGLAVTAPTGTTAGVFAYARGNGTSGSINYSQSHSWMPQ